MKRILNENLDYNRPLKIAGDIYWVGLNESAYGLQSNPYLVWSTAEEMDRITFVCRKKGDLRYFSIASLLS